MNLNQTNNTKQDNNTVNTRNSLEWTLYVAKLLPQYGWYVSSCRYARQTINTRNGKECGRRTVNPETSVQQVYVNRRTKRTKSSLTGFTRGNRIDYRNEHKSNTSQTDEWTNDRTSVAERNETRDEVNRNEKRNKNQLQTRNENQLQTRNENPTIEAKRNESKRDENPNQSWNENVLMTSTTPFIRLFRSRGIVHNCGSVGSRAEH